MTGVDWEPHGFTDKEHEDYAVLVPDVPNWLREPLIGWLRPYLIRDDWANIDRCMQLQTVTRVSVNVPSEDFVYGRNVLKALRSMPDAKLLRVVDYVLSMGGNRATAVNRSTGDPHITLVSILQAGRSKWTVGKRFGKVGLIERVPAGVQDSVESTIAHTGSAGKVLARAWGNVHGLQPSDSAAYEDAVRSVEIAAIGIVQPGNSRATLGTVLGQMKTDGNWRLPLREHMDAPGPELVLAMVRTLWYGHRDRHGSPDYSDVTHEEARAAVMLAATLVEWFTSGGLARRPVT